MDIDGEARVQGANVNMGADECMPNRVENLDTGKKYIYIQDAIDDADDGDTLEAVEYVYEETIDFGKLEVPVKLPEKVAATCDKCKHNMDKALEIEPAILLLLEKFVTLD